jgi:DNA-binding response OmpR family regulator
MSHILLVEDEVNLAEGLAFNLRNAGYAVAHVETGEEALAVTKSGEHDLILLDIMLPGVSGLEVARAIRKRGDTRPILMITALNRTDDIIAGLDAGADDYIVKPFDLDEILARVRGSLRRQVWTQTVRGDPSPNTLTYGRWTIDFRTYRAFGPEGAKVELTAKEMAILQVFARRPGDVISRQTFLEDVWGLPPSVETRTIDNFIRRLRTMFEEDAARPRHIVSVRGAGYRFRP